LIWWDLLTNSARILQGENGRILARQDGCGLIFSWMDAVAEGLLDAARMGSQRQ
jgi:hypothetical protein